MTASELRCDGCGAKHGTWVKRSMVNRVMWIVVQPGALGSRYYTPAHVVDVDAGKGLCRQCADKAPAPPTTQGSLW